MTCRPLVRMLLASAATAAAIALAGCDTDTLTRSSLRSKQPLSPQTVAEIEHKNMSKGSPILVRIFKEEAELEVWKQTREGRYALLKTYPICRWSGELGPKVREGDRQAPEGFYTITPGQLNPQSSYYLAFNMGYPNAYDRAHGRTGSQLMVHGDCSSRGCYAMTDEQIGEIYALAREAFFGGQKAFQVEAFPFRMTPVNMAKHRTNPHMAFWRMLKRGYDHFEVTRLEPQVNVCEKHYVFDAQAPTGSATPVSFNPSGKCPAYEVPADIRQAVREKEQRDNIRTAELIGTTPVAPIKTGTDGGMNPVFLAAVGAQTSHGTVPPNINPPRPAQPVYAPPQVVAESAKVVLASAHAAETESPDSGGGFFQVLGGLQATPEEETPRPLVGQPRPVQTTASPHATPPVPKPQVATVSPQRPTAVVTLKPAPAKPQVHSASAAPMPPAATQARRRSSAPPPASSSPSTMMALTGPVIRGAQPALPVGNFESRWSALR